MIFSNESIAGGIRFYAIDSNKFKSSVLTFSITAPQTAKSVAYNQLLSGLLRRGCERYPSVSDLNRSLDELYGSYVEIRSTTIGDNISFNISAEILDNKFIPDGVDTLGGVIEIVSQILLHPLITANNFNTEHFHSECKILIDNLNASKNNTRSYSILRCLELVQTDKVHPTLEQIKEIIENATLEDVVIYYKSLISTSALDVFYIGATASSVVKERIAEAFAEYPCLDARVTLLPILPRPIKAFTEGCEKMPVAQGKLSMIFNSGACISQDSNLYYTALVLNELFGGSPSSKLFTVVREKMSLCYYCSSSYSIYTGFFSVSSGIEIERFATARDAIIEQLNEIKKGNFTEEELLSAKKSLTNSYAQLYDNPFDLQAFYSGRAMFGIKDSIENCIERIWQVDADNLINLAASTTLQALFFVEGAGDNNEEEVADDE